MEHAIYTKNFKKSYGSFLALKGIDMEVRTGEIFGFLGPNGAGKDHRHSMHVGYDQKGWR